MEKEIICKRCNKSFFYYTRKKKYCDECKIAATKEKVKEYKKCNAEVLKKKAKKYRSTPQFKKTFAAWLKKPNVKERLAASQKKYREKRKIQ